MNLLNNTMSGGKVCLAWARRGTLASLAALAMLLLSVSPLAAQDRRATVEAVGQAPVELPNAREAAIEDALRRAVELGGGVEIASLSESRDYMLVRDAIFTRTAGLVERYELLLENPDQAGLYTVKISAIVSRGSLDASVAAWKALLRRKGHPRLMVVGSVDGRPFERRLTAELQGLMERRALTVIDAEMLSENRRADAERAARGELDPALAALIAREAGADYFVVAAVEGSQRSSTSYGIELHHAEATAILKVVAVDSARVIASQVATAAAGAREPAAAVRQATSEAMRRAFESAVGRIGVNWLGEVDARGGAQVTLVVRKCDFDRLTALCRLLREEPAIKEVVVDAADAQGRSFVRVITNESAANVAAFIRAADGGMVVRSTSRSELELEPAAPPPPAVRKLYPGGGGGASGPPARSPLLLGAAIGAAVVVLLLAVARLFRKGSGGA